MSETLEAADSTRLPTGRLRMQRQREELVQLRDHLEQLLRPLLNAMPREDVESLLAGCGNAELIHFGRDAVAAMLAEVGVTARIENVEWAQWLDQVFKKKQYALTIISHVEPMDIGRIYSDPGYYIQYDSQAFRDIHDRFTAATSQKEQFGELEAAQRLVAEDSVNGFLFQLAKLGVAKKGLEGMWPSWPAFINDVSAMRWE